MSNPLDLFSAPSRVWFGKTFGEPTPPQAQGWLPIQRGEHTLILAPTGSGKTLAAFLWGIDELYRKLDSPEGVPSGVHLLYISPLKALNNDIERNLRVPLEGIRDAAERQGQHLPELRVAVRTGDTPSHVRTAMWKKPPHILITTPESLYLMLTSPKAREMFRTVRTVIVDEIHTLAGNKRGVHLSLSLERLEHLADAPVQRIGLSATIKPLEEVAQFLGGQEPVEGEAEAALVSNPRPVTIVNAIYKKPIDLRVITVVDDFREMPTDSIWAPLIPRVLQDIRTHHSTLIFANNRRLAERTADRLNMQLAAEESEEMEPGSLEALAPGGISPDKGMFAFGAEGPIRAHHGSMSKAARRKMEEDLKAGHLPALVGTSSLELGIDIGSVDLVVQLQSPKSVAQGLQRVGRSGHIVGETSVGHIYPTFREDLAEAAAIARGMLEGDVEPTYTPQSPLDVLAQQIVAMVAAETWSVPELFKVVRRAYAYRDLSLETFNAVLEMLSGKYADVGQRDLRARIVWDRVNQRLAALPGSRLLAMMNAGTISDTGAYGVYLEDKKTKVGELDEEFIYETRVGDAFLLGSKVWRVLDIDENKIVVGDASGTVPRMPFWKGDLPWRPFELGMRIGKFRREVAERIQNRDESPESVEKWLRETYALDENSARNLVMHVQQQVNAVGVMSSDRTILLESFDDSVGEPRLVIHSPFGGRVNGAWALALTSALRERIGVQPETQTNDDGILFRFPQLSGEPPIALLQQMTAPDARARILNELPNSALFGAHFRMNAARALLLPRAGGKKRTPFWLQRLKAKDLLAVVSRFKDFPIIAETYRDCLRDVLDLPHLEQVLDQIEKGEIRIVAMETATPSPVASSLLYQFISVYMYEWDAPKAERQLQTLAARHELLDDLLADRGAELSELLKPEAVATVVAEQQHLAPGYQARTVEELALVIQELGDLSTEEMIARSAGDGSAWLAQLAEQGRVAETHIRTRQGEAIRWIPVELAGEYTDLAAHALKVLTRLFRASGPLTREAILDRYALPDVLEDVLASLVAAREIVRGHFTLNREAEEFVDRRNLEQMHRRTLTLLRKEIQAVPLSTFADFLARWQHAGPEARLGDEGLLSIMEQLRGIELAQNVWKRDVLPARLVGHASPDLDALAESGDLVQQQPTLKAIAVRKGLNSSDLAQLFQMSSSDAALVWVAHGTRVRFFFRGEGVLFLGEPDDAGLGAGARSVYDYLKAEGASFTSDLERGVKLKGVPLNEALAELATRGLITNDSLDALHEISSASRKSGSPPTSALESELDARLNALSPGPRRPSRGRYQDAKRRVAQRLRAEPRRSPSQGRWALVHRAGIMGPVLSEEARAEKIAQMLLARYGVVTRECLAHEEGIGDWSRLYPALQRMEMRGQVRRGYFVAGLAGIQFALPEAVEALRTAVKDSMIVLNATDPANLYGGELPGVTVRLARVPSNSVVMWRGQPVLVAEENGERITAQPDTTPDIVRRALEAWLTRPGAPRHLAITTWNSAPVLSTPAEEMLASMNFHRTPTGMER